MTSHDYPVEITKRFIFSCFDYFILYRGHMWEVLVQQETTRGPWTHKNNPMEGSTASWEGIGTQKNPPVKPSPLKLSRVAVGCRWYRRLFRSCGNISGPSFRSDISRFGLSENMGFGNPNAPASSQREGHYLYFKPAMEGLDDIVKI